MFVDAWFQALVVVKGKSQNGQAIIKASYRRADICGLRIGSGEIDPIL
jgi:hypothetical protein